ncbi:MAG: mannitol dehydrogenase family protein [Stappiaceae bacterium]
MSRILHFGVGNFSRAHQFWYTQNTNENWRITGVSLRRPDIRDILKKQDFDYTLAIYSPQKADFERVTILDDILVAPEDPDRVIQAVADPSVTIITITVTEKGYSIDPVTGTLDLEDAQIKTDLETGVPSSLMSFLANGLKARADNKSGPLTILSCDNLSGNGDRLKSGVVAFAQQAGFELETYIEQEVAFPNSMVDRITPATTEELKSDVFDKTGWKDQAPVATEQFSEWIIEDRFCSARPDWNRAGARIVDDVSPYELRKLRLLNGPHSLLAYFGQLKRHRFVHEAIADPEVLKNVQGLMREAMSTLPEPIRSESPAYCEELIERFSNPALRHSLKQIAMDGTEKLPIRILPVLQQFVSHGQEAPFVQHAIACWLAYVVRQNEERRPVDDPQSSRIAQICRAHEDAAGKVNGLLELLDLTLSRSKEADQLKDKAVQLATI